MTDLKNRITVTKEDKVSLFIGELFHSQTQAHIFHLQTSSFAEHKALEDYYSGIDGLIDNLVETYQGENPKVLNYPNLPFKNYTSNSEVINYFKNLHSHIKNNKSVFVDSDYLNIVDEIVSLIKSTLYKLKHLK